MKLEVGMYVRTKDGIILKIDKIEDICTTDNIFIGMCIYDNEGHFINDVEIVKASHSLLGDGKEEGVIEVGDYVNRELVSRIKKCPEWHGGDGIVIYNEHNETIYSNFRTSKYGSIKSIVTKEMFSSMEYKVGE